MPNIDPTPENDSSGNLDGQNQPVRYIPPDLTIFDNVETERSVRARKAGYLAELAMNGIFATLKSYVPEDGKATDINKLAGALKTLADLEEQLKPGGDNDPANVKDITAEMGRILRGSKGATGQNKSKPKQGKS